MNQIELACMILDYWFAIEFLGQEGYEECTEERKIKRKLAKYLGLKKAEKGKYKQLMIFDDIEDKEICDMVDARGKETEMPLRGNLTFFVGRVKRQKCIEVLAQKLGKEIKQSENSEEYIPVLSFQCNRKGEYLERSISLSPILWAISNINNKCNMSETLSLEKKNKEEATLETVFFNKEEIMLTPCDNDDNWSVEAISKDKLDSIFNYLSRKYDNYFSNSCIEKKISMKYQIFRDVNTQMRYDDDNYMGLSHDFFSKDLQMVKFYLQNSINTEQDEEAIKDLLSYICAPYSREELRDRIDLIKTNDKKKYYQLLFEILDIKNGPLGKWPSRFMPGLMQQVAINLAISEKVDGIWGKNGKVFSVNGPPGTGKTTLLKEIIVSNIIEKAKCLVEVENPDDLFERVSFIEGKEGDGAYSTSIKYWYRLKNSRVTKYGVLVTSCNNAAVENITKELPVEKRILKELSVKEEDSSEMKLRIQHSSKLFSLDMAKDTMVYRGKNNEEMEAPEIYYSPLANMLFDKGDKNSRAWGLIAAPLGKKSNISTFYYDVLRNIIFMKAEEKEKAKERYKERRDEFIQQLQKVCAIRDSIAIFSKSLLEKNSEIDVLMAEKERLIKQRDNYENQYDKLSGEISEIEKEKGNVDKRYDDVKEKYDVLIDGIKKLTSEFNDKNDERIKIIAQADAIAKKCNVLVKVFNRKAYDNNTKMMNAISDKADSIANFINDIKAEIKTKKEHEELVEQEKKALEKTRESIAKKLKELSGEIEVVGKEKAECVEAINRKETRINELHVEVKNSIETYGSQGELKRGVVLDADLLERLLSDDARMSTEAHVLNPWASEEYNQEREKLFYLALQVEKEFVCGSNACISNIKNLSSYWGLYMSNNNERINFGDRDRLAMMPSLFNSLLILVPVISSTFASVGRLLKDINSPQSIGTLVIDEAGQAQPQMAVGALFRSSKAIIVGDPKQVEPVVTDDLNLLKESFSELEYLNYKDKSLSVQKCADINNHFGTFLLDEDGEKEWVGCPLVVHRRCISPMFDISNMISYQGIMKQKTALPEETISFICKKSMWIDIKGKETGKGNHYVVEQGQEVGRLVAEAFQNSEEPSLYIISPFNSVISGVRKEIKRQIECSGLNHEIKGKMEEWLYDNVGTVHKFQGKEADEVIFVLGCDIEIRDRYAVKQFVNKNIVNVAATRAKYRLYVVGDYDTWQTNPNLRVVKNELDEYSETKKCM